MLRFVLFIIALMMLGLGPLAILGLLLLLLVIFSD